MNILNTVVLRKKESSDSSQLRADSTRFSHTQRESSVTVEVKHISPIQINPLKCMFMIIYQMIIKKNFALNACNNIFLWF